MNDNINTESVTLIISSNCNLNCIYCYEKHKENMMMDFDTASVILFKFLNDEKNTDKALTIEFFGGEPFLNFRLMKELVQWVRERTWKRKEYKFFIDTNGTLIRDVQKEWIVENRDLVTVGISLDGNREMHNINRSNSFDRIPISFFKKYYPEQPVKMTISKQTLPYIFDGITYIHKKGLKVTANLAYGQNWCKEDEIIYSEQLKLLVNWYLQHKEIDICSVISDFNPKYLNEHPERQLKQHQYCGAGIAMHCYQGNDNEKEYPCQFFAPITLGEQRAEKFERSDIQELYNSSEIDQKCAMCYARNSCPHCIGSCYLTTGNIWEKDSVMCGFYKQQYKIAAYYYFCLWEQGELRNYSETEELALLNGIQLAQKL